jgi:gas vesicle protein
MVKRGRNNMAKGKLALGALIGAAAGFVSGILLAPKSGKETREEIKSDALKFKDAAVKEVNDTSDKVKAEASKLKKDVTDKAEELKGQFNKVADDTKKTVAAKKSFFSKTADDKKK